MCAQHSDDPAGAVKVFWSTRDWAETVAPMPVEGPLPCRTVLVPRETPSHPRQSLRGGGESEGLSR